MWIIVGDLHLTDQARDEYRFGIFKWLAKQQAKHPVAATFLAGDLTDSKNRHSAALVNKLIDGLTSLRPPVYVCKGNHDYRDPSNPFFRFISHINGLHFVTDASVAEHGKRMGIIAHVRDQASFDGAVAQCGKTDAFLVHQTFDGAIAETGARLSGLSASAIESLKPPLGVYAGDVHRPQTQGIVRYIGCPYHVRFGDGFTPQVLYVRDDGKIAALRFPAPFKHSLTVRDADDIYNNADLAEDDQVKLTVEVPREEVVDWKQIKAGLLEACSEMGVAVYGCRMEVKTTKTKERTMVKGFTNAEIFEQFSLTEKLASQTKKVGIQIMEDTNGQKSDL